MAEASPRIRKWKKRWNTKLRLVLMNSETFAETFSLTLRPLRFIILITSSLIFLIASVIALIAFTPLREYIPGYTDIATKRKVQQLSLKSDSLSVKIRQNQRFLQSLQAVVTDSVDTGKPAKPDSTKKYQNVDLAASKAELEMRKRLEGQGVNISSGAPGAKANTGIGTLFFSAPLRGLVTASYNPDQNHYGIDIAVKENTPVVAVLDGRVVFAGYTPDNGYVIQVQHSNEVLSFYKHNAQVAKQIGQAVKAGEIIAFSGNTGELSRGPHLHFELWYRGIAVNPQDYIVF